MTAISKMIVGAKLHLNPNNNNFYGVTKALANIFGVSREELSTIQPTSAKELSDFIDLLLEIDTHESKSQSDLRQRAWKLIKAFIANPPNPPQFANVDVLKFAFQLALRVREPQLIAQGNLGICGANAVVVYHARQDPHDYAQLGINLMTTGQGKFGQKKLEPNPNVKAGFNTVQLAEADYVILTAVRGSATLVEKVLRTQGKKARALGIGAGLAPGAVTEILRAAGYTHVEDHSHDFSTTNWNKNLAKAKQRVEEGYLVMFSINAKLAQAMVDDKAMELSSLDVSGDTWEKSLATASSGKGELLHPLPSRPIVYSNHWVLVRKFVITEKESITIKLYSWGESVKRTIPYKKFLDYYDGFISAKLGGEERRLSISM